MITSKNKKRIRTLKGFTLVEAMAAMVIIGIAIAALIASSQAFTRSNGAGIDISTAEFLIEEIRELTASMDTSEVGTTVLGPETGETSLTLYDDVDDFDGAVFSPPVDINRAAMAEFTGFSQQITVEKVSTSDLTVVVSDSDSSTFVKITVQILVNGNSIATSSWIRAQM